MPHEEHAKFIAAVYDLITHYPLFFLQLELPHLKLVKRIYGSVARTVRIVDSRPINSFSVLPDREAIRDAERLAVAYDHSRNLAAGNPGTHPCLHAYSAKANLILRANLMEKSITGNQMFVRSPAKFGRSYALFKKALDAPCVHKFVYLFGLIRDLRIPFAYVDGLNAF